VRSTPARAFWLLTGVLIAGAVRPAAAGDIRGGDPAGVAQLWRPFPNDPHNVLEGNWQSCRENDGQYAERVYDHVVNGVGQFEVHMGPRREFAIFKGVQEAHRDHDSPENLLKPFRVPLEYGRAKQRWEIPSLNLVFTATLAGGSRTDCESWFLVLAPLEKTSH